MIIAGNCLLTHPSEINIVERTASLLKKEKLADYFRCKIWGGGTTPQRFYKGIGNKGIDVLKRISRNILPAGTEVQIPQHIIYCRNLSFIWIGARNCQNYALLENLTYFDGKIFIKRGAGITIDETIGLFDIMRDVFLKKIFIIERGINTFDRKEESRWSPDLKGIIRIKDERPDIFGRIVIDCSHSAGKKEYTRDIYNAFKSIGVKHFMFEVSAEPEKSKTDTAQILSTQELKEILK